MKYVWVVLREKYPHYKDSFEISVEKVFGTKEAADRYVNGKYKDLAEADLSENYILYEIDSHDATTYISIRKVEIEY
jgi:hypothetical protein